MICTSALFPYDIIQYALGIAQFLRLMLTVLEPGRSGPSTFRDSNLPANYRPVWLEPSRKIVALFEPARFSKCQQILANVSKCRHTRRFCPWKIFLVSNCQQMIADLFFVGKYQQNDDDAGISNLAPARHWTDMVFASGQRVFVLQSRLSVYCRIFQRWHVVVFYLTWFLGLNPQNLVSKVAVVFQVRSKKWFLLIK